MASALAVGAGACADDEVTHTHAGVVVDTDGAPVAGALVQIGAAETRTGARGRYEVDAAEPDGWVRVRARGLLSRTRASSSGEPLLVRLTPEADRTLSVHFTGDTMAGRRFYDRNEDGDTSDGQLGIEPTLEEHRALLSDIEPLLADADLTVVNLETPLTRDPWYDPGGERPATFHPTKEFAFSSHPLLARALADAGVDAVDLGNNHLYDRLDEGVTETIRALDDAGLVHYGAGATVEAAWEPAIVDRKGQSIALLGCTTITGEEHAIAYVATADHGGAAPCDPDLLVEAVRAAAARVDVVVLSIHGGFEYGAEPSARVADLTDLARTAGARLVVNHHPHVVGGIDRDGSALVAENMGNFLFDQTIWQTFPGYVLRAELRAGRVVRSYAEPIVVADFRPRGLAGDGAAHVQRIAAGLGGPDLVMEDGAVEVDIRRTATERTVTVPIDDPQGRLLRVAPGVEVRAIDGGRPRVGRDVLRVGDFEDHQVGGDDSHHSFWERQRGREVGPDLGRGGGAGARISRTSGDRSDAFFNPRHRILLAGGTDVTFTGRVRGGRSARVLAQLSWFPDTRGPSSERSVERIDLGRPRSDGWVPFRVDATAPVDAVAVGVYLRLQPPGAGRQNLRIDDLAVVAWTPPGTEPGPEHDHVDLVGPATIEAMVRHLPGGTAWAERVLAGPIVVPVP